MKRKLFICWMAFFPVAIMAQGPSLTKEETVNYINKKLAEVLEKSIGGEFITLNKLTYMEDGGYISHEDKMETSTAGCSRNNSLPYNGKYTKLTFKPEHVTRIDSVASGSAAIGILRITLLPNTAKWSVTNYHKSVTAVYKKKYSHTDFWGNAQYNNEYSHDKVECLSNPGSPGSNRVYVYFLKADPANFGKLQRAFNHLVALYKAEDDPFAK